MQVRRVLLAFLVLCSAALLAYTSYRHPITRSKVVTATELEGQKIILFSRRVAPWLHDAITGMFRNTGVNLTDLGIAFCTPSIRRIWPDLAFRPLQDSIDVEQAVAYRRDSHSPVLSLFLVRQAARTAAGK